MIGNATMIFKVAQGKLSHSWFQYKFTGMGQKLIKQFSGYVWQFMAIVLSSITMLISSPIVASDEVAAAVKKGTIASFPKSRYVLSSIFGMRQTTWPDGSATMVFVLPEDAQLNSLFCKQILHPFPRRLCAAWDRLVYAGAGQAPIVRGSAQEMETRMANTPGAIDYLPKETIDDKIAVLLTE